MQSDDVLFFGCWNQAGHYMFGPQGGRVPHEVEERATYYGDYIHLDGSLAPRKHRRNGSTVWAGSGKSRDDRRRLDYDSNEFPQGQFLRHVLDNGYTAIQWWDRCQGDTRGACNSTVLVKGERTTEEMLAALATYFPSVLANLTKAGVTLVEIKLEVNNGKRS